MAGTKIMATKSENATGAVGDIIIIRPTTEYANNISEVLAVSHTKSNK